MLVETNFYDENYDAMKGCRQIEIDKINNKTVLIRNGYFTNELVRPHSHRSVKTLGIDALNSAYSGTATQQ